jgi:hypothetical protein
MGEQIDNSQRAKDMLEQAFGTNSDKVHKVLRNNATAKAIYDAAISVVTAILDGQPVGITESLDIMGSWGERLLRDQGFLMDLMIAGCIDTVKAHLPAAHQVDSLTVTTDQLQKLAASGRVQRLDPPVDLPGSWSVRLTR